MAASDRRLLKELSQMKSLASDMIKVVEVDESNLRRWVIQLKPESQPYDKGAFKVSIEFPTEYPFKPPRVTFFDQDLPSECG